MPSTTITASALETAGVTFAGAFAGGFLEGVPVLRDLALAGLAAVGVLGYHFASSNVKQA